MLAAPTTIKIVTMIATPSIQPCCGSSIVPTIRDTAAATTRIFKHKSSKHSITNEKNDRALRSIGWLLPNFDFLKETDAGSIPLSMLDSRVFSSWDAPPKESRDFSDRPSRIWSRSNRFLHKVYDSISADILSSEVISFWISLECRSSLPAIYYERTYDQYTIIIQLLSTPRKDYPIKIL